MNERLIKLTEFFLAGHNEGDRWLSWLMLRELIDLQREEIGRLTKLSRSCGCKDVRFEMSINVAKDRYECRKCKMVEYRDKHLSAEIPIWAAYKVITKRHKKTRCSGVPAYRDGI